MDLSIYPPEIQQLMLQQMMLSQQPQAPNQNAPADARAEAIAQHVTAIPGDPRLIGNDALRQQFADHPELAPTNDPGWIDQREQHLLGNDAPPVITATAPMSPPSPPPMLPQAPQSPVQAQQPLPAPQQPPMLPPPPQAAAAPPPMPAPPLPPQSAPMLAQQAQITPFPQQPAVMSQVSPAPAVAAHANIDNSVTPSHPTFTQAYQPPPLPTFMNASLVPNLGGYKPAPQIPGYAQPRQGSPFMAPHPAAQAPQLPSFDNPFGPGGLTAGQSYNAQTQDPNDIYSRLLMQRAPNTY